MYYDTMYTHTHSFTSYPLRTLLQIEPVPILYYGLNLRNAVIHFVIHLVIMLALDVAFHGPRQVFPSMMFIIFIALGI